MTGHDQGRINITSVPPVLNHVWDKSRRRPTEFTSRSIPVKAAHSLPATGSSVCVHKGYSGQIEYLQSGWISKYKMVYITRFPRQHDIETKNGKENGHSYSYLEAIDTVDN